MRFNNTLERFDHGSHGRRAWLEAQGAEASVRALEDAVRHMPTVRTNPDLKGTGKPKKNGRR